MTKKQTCTLYENGVIRHNVYENNRHTFRKLTREMRAHEQDVTGSKKETNENGMI